MPVASTDPTERHRLRSIARWLPGVILVLATVGSTGVMIQIDGPAAAGPAAEDRTPSATPILSLRRDLDSLVDVAADGHLRRRLDEFVATQPADTCLQVEVDDFRYSHRADDPQSPASVQKLLTAVAVLTEHGARAHLHDRGPRRTGRRRAS